MCAYVCILCVVGICNRSSSSNNKRRGTRGRAASKQASTSRSRSSSSSSRNGTGGKRLAVLYFGRLSAMEKAFPPCLRAGRAAMYVMSSSVCMKCTYVVDMGLDSPLLSLLAKGKAGRGKRAKEQHWTLREKGGRARALIVSGHLYV